MSTIENPSVATTAPLDSRSREPSDAPPNLQNDAPPSAAATSMEVSPAPETALPLPLDTPQLESQPMTASASSSSLHPAPENGETSAAGYGTRSRNRTGGTRPNYAEDKELDIELDTLPKVSRSSKRSSAANSELHSTSSGFAAINNAYADHPSENVTTPSSSTPAPAPSASAVPSKKRKHPGSSHTVAPHATMASSSRSRHAATVAFKGYVETNMMSFHRAGKRLNTKKQLVADDGTTVQANGKSILSTP